jgi:predicted ArsR family transcriptional regulator
VDRDHELAAVLADDTRYRIYRSIVERGGDEVTVADIATRFSLHPNVARMHLAKLEQAGFLDAGLRKTSGGGRPARLYRLSDQVVSLGFPPRRYELLSRLALGSLAEGGDVGDIERACRDIGAAEGRQALARHGGPPADTDTALRLVARVAEEQGLLPDVEWQSGRLLLTVRNCAFAELSGSDPELVCSMHRAFLAGLLEVVLDSLGTVACANEGGRLSQGEDRCTLACSLG